MTKAINLALSTYDVVVFAWLGEGWLHVASHHAVSKSVALSHGISIYLGATPTPDSSLTGCLASG